MFDLRGTQLGTDMLSSKLLDQNTFYNTFMRDLSRARREVIIESPFISFKRLNHIAPTLQKLVRHGVIVAINTKPPEEQEPGYRDQAEDCIAALLNMGIKVLFTGGHHRKLAIIDREILYEGSLNILSQNDSCEIMRRIYSAQLAGQMVAFIGINGFIN